MSISINTQLSVFLLLLASSSCWARNEWISHGGDLENRRFAQHELKINPTSVRERFKQQWRYIIGSDVSATPAISDSVVYVPSWNGLVVALTLHGDPIWQVNLTELTGINGALSRTTPAVTKNLLILGLLGPARVVALSRWNGRLEWISPELDQTPLARITMSGTAYKGAFYVGISSTQEIVEPLCCTFQGSFQKLDLRTGLPIWKTFMVPVNTNFTGVALWGSSPSIDPRRGLVYVATGNLYTVPQDVQDCFDQNGNSSNVCVPSGVCDDAVVAIDMRTGAIRWCKRLGGTDVFRIVCVRPNPPPNCRSTPGPDYDFGEAPMMLTVPSNISRPRDIIVTGQKSGIVWAFDRTTGELVWETVAGPGGPGGGAVWGVASDNHQVYTNIANTDKHPFVLAPSSKVTTAGGWVAMDAATGKINWSTGNPTGERAYGPVSVANGVVFAGSFDKEGHVFAMDAGNGQILWKSTTGATLNAGISIGYGCGFVGSGYARPPVGPVFNGTPGDSLYAFCIS